MAADGEEPKSSCCWRFDKLSDRLGTRDWGQETRDKRQETGD